MADNMTLAGNQEFKSWVLQLKQDIRSTQIKAAIKVALLSEKAVDVDYLTFKLNEKLKEKLFALKGKHAFALEQSEKPAVVHLETYSNRKDEDKYGGIIFRHYD